jgi:toxin ParE1/3/4
VSGVRLSRAARADLIQIAARSAEGWGVQHAADHIAALYRQLESLTAMPGLGRPCDHIRPGLRRFEHPPHVIFYRAMPDGAPRIVRVLSDRMLPAVSADDETE